MGWDPHQEYKNAKELSHTTSLGYHPKPFYMPQTKRKFLHFQLLFIWVGKAMLPLLYSRGGSWCMMYAAVSNHRSWNVLGKQWRSLTALWEKSWEITNFKRKLMWLCKVESNLMTIIRITQFFVLCQKCLSCTKWKESKFGYPLLKTNTDKKLTEKFKKTKTLK